MRAHFSLKVFVGFLALGAAGCSGGSTDSTASVSIRCGGGEAFCLISCDLGCSQTGCSVTEIAENQRLRFVFSSRIAANTVNASTFSIRTPSGIAPDGDLLVADREITFVPRVSTTAGVSSFGFARNESYVITLAKASGNQGLRSVSGDGLEQEFSCTVLASRGIQDEDQQPPSVILVAPTSTTGLPQNPTIVLRFSELIDTTALQGVLTAASPVNFRLRGTIDAGGGVLACDPDAAGLAVEGIPTLTTERVGAADVTVVTFSPPLPLPGASCLTVSVTGDLRDLSGRGGIPATFELFTAPTPPLDIVVEEEFVNPTMQDVDQSSGLWTNGARAGLVGDDGRHGSFSLGLAVLDPVTGFYEIDTGATPIPASNTFSGLPTTVTDGKYYFSDFVLPANTTLRFKGAFPPQIFVRGKVEILGKINLNAADLPFWTLPALPDERLSDFGARSIPPALPLSTTSFPDGQDGSLGGIGGGRGGKGGKECNGVGDVQVPPGSGIFIHRGQPGQDVRVAAGHAYAAQAVGTGGRGSLLHPVAGTAAAANTPTFPFSATSGGTIRASFAPGGGGGGFSLAGSIAVVPPVAPPALPYSFGVIQSGGLPFNLALPTPLPAGFSSLNHFVVGGSGGGGGGSHAFGTSTAINNDVYVAGSGGSGGGGTMAIRAGGNVTIAASARFESRGGRGVLITGDDKATPARDTNYGVSSPGGGGSGGSVLIQAGGNLVMNGTVDTTGGEGSETGNVQLGLVVPNYNIVSQAGAGSPGFYRLEAGGAVTVGPSPSIPAYVPGLHSDVLLDRDEVTASLSKWRTSGQLFPPTWLRYELDVDLDGDTIVDITYTDSGAVGTQRANDPAGPVRIQFQGAVLDQAGTAPVPGEDDNEWRDGIGSGAGPGIGLDSPNGFRFFLRFNRSVAPNCTVVALRVFAQA